MRTQKKYGVLLIALVLLSKLAFGQVFQHMYSAGGNPVSDPNAHSHHPTPDGGYIMCGTSDPGSSQTFLTLIKVSPNGTVVWQKNIVDPNYNLSAREVIPIDVNDGIPDDGFIICASAGSISGNNILLIKLDPMGTITWQQHYSTPQRDNYPYDMLQDATGFIVVAGTSLEQVGNNDSDPFILKVNTSGVIQWFNIYQMFNNVRDELGGITECSNGDYTVATSSGVNSYGFIEVFRINNAGTTIFWSYEYSAGNSILVANDIQATQGGGFIICGSFDDQNSTTGLLLNIAGDGNILWSKHYWGSFTTYQDVKETSAGNYLVGGLRLGGSYFPHAIGVNSFGGIIWSQRYFSTNGTSGYGSQIHAESDGSISLSGFEMGTSFGNGIFLLHTDPLGKSCNDAPISDAPVSIPMNLQTLPLTPTSGCIITPSAVQVFPNLKDAELCSIIPCLYPPIVNIASSTGSLVVCTADLPLQLTANTSSGTAPFTYLWNGPNIMSGQGSPTITINGEGTYQVWVTDANGCVTYTFVNVYAFPPADVSIPSVPSPVCLDAAPFTLSGIPSGGTWSGPGVSPSGVFDPALAGPGVHTVIYTVVQIACSTSAAAQIEVLPPDVINWPVIPPVCSGTILLGDATSGPSPYGGSFSCATCPAGTIIGPVGSNQEWYLNTAVTGAGTFPIEYSYTNLSGCTATATQNVVVQPDNWHQQTSLAATSGETGNDVVIDPSGNVYVTGKYEYSTVFDDRINTPVIIASNNSPRPTMYVAKYSPCGALLWVNYDVAFNSKSEGTGVAVDALRGVVYVTGSVQPGPFQVPMILQATAASPGVPATPAAATPVVGYFVAAFDLITGNFITFYNGGNSNRSSSAIDLRSLGGSTELFVCGKTQSGLNSKAFVQKLVHTGTITGSWLQESTHLQNGSGEAHDLIYDALLNRVHVIGDFSNNLSFGSVTVMSSAVSDAYMVSFHNSGVVILASLQKANVSALIGNSEAHGTGIAVDASGNIYCTGYFRGVMSNMFNSGTSLSANALVSLRTRAFVCAKLQSSPSWAHQLIAGGFPNAGNAASFGTGIAVNSSGVVICGYFRNGNLNLSSPYDTYPSSNTGADKLFFAAYDLSGNEMWANSTFSPVGSSGDHRSSRIAIDETIGYAAGTFNKTMQYALAVPAPASGDLVSSSLSGNPTATNMYLVQLNLFLGGNLRTANDDITTNESPAGTINSETSFSVNVFPNPSTGPLTVTLEYTQTDQPTLLEVYNLYGQLVKSEQLAAGTSTINLDLSNSGKGIYILRFTNGTNTQAQRVIIE